MPIIRKKLQSSDVYPDGIRYDEGSDTVQTKIGDDWIDSPEADPRRQTIYPPRSTSDTRCDAAQSVADALKNQIDQAATAVDNAKTAFTIAGIILSLLTFGVFGIFVSLALTLADVMLTAGKAAIDAALTAPVYQQLTCILYCNMDSFGRLTESGLTDVESDVDTQIGGLGATIINSMLHLAGFGGVNNLAALGTSTGDCSECDCGCVTFTGSVTLFFGTGLTDSDIHPGWLMATPTLQGDGSYYIGVDFTSGTPDHGIVLHLDPNGNSIFPYVNQAFWQCPCHFNDGCYGFGNVEGVDVTGFYIRSSDAVAPIHFKLCDSPDSCT